MTAVKLGTCGVVSDPHEIVNVLGIADVGFMLNDAKKVIFNFFFGAPSWVPATSFETNGANLDHEQVRKLLEMKEIKYLSEMNILETCIKSRKIFTDGKVLFKFNAGKAVNNFN